MAMEITNNYNAYENIYATQKQQTEKKQAASGKETSETVDAQKNSKVGNDKTKSTADYAKKLEKLVPSVEFRVGNACVSAQSGKSLTVNPKLLEKMQNDPKKEKDMKELIKGVESATKLMDGIYKASGWSVVYRHSYIDENGKYSAIACVRNDFMLNMSDKLREERRENSEKLIEKTKEKAAEKEKELEETLEENKTEIAVNISRQGIRSGTQFRSTGFSLRTTGSLLGSTNYSVVSEQVCCSGLYPPQSSGQSLPG